MFWEKLDWETVLAKVIKSLSMCPLQIHYIVHQPWKDVGRWWYLPGSFPESQSRSESMISSVFVLLKRCSFLFLLFRMSWLCVCLFASPWVDPFNALSFTCSDLCLLWSHAGRTLLRWKMRCRKAVFQKKSNILACNKNIADVIK